MTDARSCLLRPLSLSSWSLNVSGLPLKHLQCLVPKRSGRQSHCNLHPCLIRWIAAFFQGRSQSVRIGSDSSNIRSLNGGIPQGTKLGPVLFSVMVNDLVSSWPKRTKYVDDLTILENRP